jgi:xylulokinase
VAQPWILAIDFGNGGPKVGAVALSGELLATALRGVAVDIGSDGRATQDAGEWENRLAEAVTELVACAGVDAGAVRAVAITGQWGSTVPVGSDGRPSGPVLLWADSRGARHSRKVIGGIGSIGGYQPAKALPWIRLTGGGPSPEGTDPTGHALLLRHELAAVGQRTKVLLEPVDYLAFRCTGRAVATPASMILSWLTDNRMGAVPRYVPELVRRARRDPALLPELVPTGTVQGPLLPDAANWLGIAPGVPVITGIPDFHAAVLGSGAVAPFQTHMAVSTTAWFGARVPFKKTDILHQIASVPGIDPGHHIVINNIDAAGAALQWLREQIIAPDDGLVGGGSGIGADGAAAPWLAPSYEALIDLAAHAPPGSEGVLFAPWLNGERSPVEDKRIRATWLNLSFRTDRAVLIRSVLEGVAFNARWLFDAYERFLGHDVPTIRLIGGGAQSDVWSQIIAGILDRPVERVADPRNAQLRGVALWAQVCLGERRLDEVGRDVEVDRVFRPADTDRETYQRLYREYRRLYGTLKHTYARLNERR